MKADNSIKKPGWEVIGRYVTGEASHAEIRHVETWAESAEQNRKELEKIIILMKQSGIYYRLKRFDSQEAWQIVQKRIRKESAGFRISAPVKKTRALFYRYAAVVLVAVLLGAAGFLIAVKPSGELELTRAVKSGNQKITEYNLPDGSVVALNFQSELYHPPRFSRHQRKVAISGEAFFDIKSDPDSPFIIDAGKARIKVLGTSFNVYSCPETDSVEVTVERGEVQVLVMDGQVRSEKDLTLNAGEKAVVYPSAGKLKKIKNKDLNYLAWKTHNFLFKGTPLPEVVLSLEKTYNTHVDLKDKSLENLHLTAQFENKPVEFILDVIRLTFNLELNRENNVWIFSEKTMSNNNRIRP